MATPPSRDGGQEESQTGSCRREPDPTASQGHPDDPRLRVAVGDGCSDLPGDGRRRSVFAGWNLPQARLRQSRSRVWEGRGLPLLGERSPVGSSCRACSGRPEVECLELALPADQRERSEPGGSSDWRRPRPELPCCRLRAAPARVEFAHGEEAHWRHQRHRASEGRSCLGELSRAAVLRWSSGEGDLEEGRRHRWKVDSVPVPQVPDALLREILTA